MPQPVKNLAILTALPGKADELRALLGGMIAPSRAEPGNLQYDLWADPAAPGRFVLDELYAGRAALEAHRATGHFQAYLAVIGTLAERSAMVLDPLDIA